MYGTRAALSTASSASTTATRTPEAPRASEPAFSASTSRTTSLDSGSPTPTLCERIRLRCSVARSSALMRVDASLPKPVLTPYTGASPAAARCTTAALAAMAWRAASSISSVALPACSACSCSRLKRPGISFRVGFKFVSKIRLPPSAASTPAPWRRRSRCRNRRRRGALRRCRGRSTAHVRCAWPRRRCRRRR